MNIWQLLVLFQHELLLFAGFFFLIGALDDLAIDAVWLWRRFIRREATPKLDGQLLASQPLRGQAAVFIPAWQEAEVIGDTIAHALSAWPHADLRLYVGCYRNDSQTIASVMAAAGAASGHDRRVRLVIHDREGPSTKADCLNRLYRALEADEVRMGQSFRMVVFHDAEDMVDPAGLPLLDAAIGEAQFAQLPVLPLPSPQSRWLGSHYCEEFAEAHGKAMVVRDALGAAIPAAGVGCAVEREALAKIAALRRSDGADRSEPFAADSLTEDYELGLGIAAIGGKGRFVRARDVDGALIATRAFFPERLDHVVRQKTRWVHGIALQGWDRHGWSGSPVELWMRMRDRRGPLTALVLFIAYLLLGLAAVGGIAALAGKGETMEVTPLLWWILAINLIAFVWRAGFRFAFTTREYGWAEGLRAVVRIPLANIIAIMAGRRALFDYVRTLGGAAVSWDKTPHFAHPSRVAHKWAAS